MAGGERTRVDGPAGLRDAMGDDPAPARPGAARIPEGPAVHHPGALLRRARPVGRGARAGAAAVVPAPRLGTPDPDRRVRGDGPAALPAGAARGDREQPGGGDAAPG